MSCGKTFPDTGPDIWQMAPLCCSCLEYELLIKQICDRFKTTMDSNNETKGTITKNL